MHPIKSKTSEHAHVDDDREAVDLANIASHKSKQKEFNMRAARKAQTLECSNDADLDEVPPL